MSVNQQSRQTEHHWITMPDGIKLAARIWWPQGNGPFPAILEYIPYRKRDMVRARDERNHPYFAAHGYVCLRVDMRGSGDSEGHMPDMYSDNELADARHVIDWIADQVWCTGKVGMFGTSWGGTASLQTAVDAPVALKAVLANCATTNRFEDDIHWMGGGLLTDSFEWGATLPAILAAPPDAATVGELWFEQWQERLAKLTFPLDNWIRNDRRGSYWRHGSVLFNADRLSCPVLSIGGWSDRYSNSVLGLVQSKPDSCWGIVGPWGHHYPDQGEPGPAISFQDVALEWWDYWLKGDADGDLGWPRIRLWRREYDPPQDRLAERNGQWIEINDPTESDGLKLYPAHEGLMEQPDSEPRFFVLPNDLRHGECSGDTGYFGRFGGLPLEQSADDARALCFDSAPLENDLDLIGHAEWYCEIERDHAEAQLVCRLCEVTADGESHLVTRQILNLALDQILDKTTDFVAGEPVSYRMRFPSTAYRFTRGNRIRLAIASSYWPLVWPAAERAAIRLLSKQAYLHLPAMNCFTGLSAPLPPARQLPEQPSWTVTSAGPLQRIQGEFVDGRVESSWQQPQITFHFQQVGLAISLSTNTRYNLALTGSGIMGFEIEHVIAIQRSDGVAHIRSSLNAESDQSGLALEATLSVQGDAECMAEKTWRKKYPAHHLVSK